MLQPFGISEASAFASDALWIALTGFVVILRLGDCGRLESVLREFIGHLRDTWDSFGLTPMPDLVRKQLDGLVMLAVELERARGDLQKS